MMLILLMSSLRHAIFAVALLAVVEYIYTNKNTIFSSRRVLPSYFCLFYLIRHDMRLAATLRDGAPLLAMMFAA